MEANKLRLIITSNFGKIFDGNVKMVSLRIETGYIGILANHVPLVSNIKPCILVINLGESKKEFVIGSGLITSHKNEVKILSTEIEDHKEVNISKTQNELKFLTTELSKIANKSSQEATHVKDKIKFANLKLEWKQKS